ncbi:MAG: hypothetical protein H7A32_01120 [Deltaproteobacteria bacterium]|nr:hypothetical protein [Deltaproteobacteria bacterium]
MKALLHFQTRFFFLLFCCLSIPLLMDSLSYAQESSRPLIKKASAQKHIIPSKKHQPNQIQADLDGDDVLDTVTLVQNLKNKKYGLEISFGNGKKEYLAMGRDLLEQGVDNLDWVGVFKKAPRGSVYWNNVNEEGDIISNLEVKDEEKIKLKHDGIFIHNAESCGGGIIYFESGKFKWIQQE